MQSKKKTHHFIPLILFIFIICTSEIFSDPSVQLGVIEVIGNRESLRRIPGAGAVIDSKTLNLSSPLSTGEALRKVSGIYIRDEDGQSLRPNISIRGIDGNRSVKLLLLEDGLPVTLAPYGENSAYYAPVIDRATRIEILKGSGSILYGPQTIGGVINYITELPPLQETSRLKVVSGTNGYINLQTDYGVTHGQTGILLQALYKGGNGLREHMPFGVYDVRGKVVIGLSDTQDLTLKAQYFNEDSIISYVGLTKTMYDENPNQNPALHDQLFVERFGITATHSNQDFLKGKLDTSLYAYTTRRDFWRQSYDRVKNVQTTYERISGNGNDNDSIFWKNANNGNNRTYEVVGIEPRYQTGNFQSGLKLHYETEINQKITGAKADARTGTLGTDERRSTLASAAYIQNRFQFSEKWDLTPGLRVESFRQTRDILKANTDDVSGRTDMIVEWIPGIGTTYQVSDDTTLFAGVHRGFAPPKFADALSSTGIDQQLEAEKSWNYELGTRTTVAGAKVNITGFLYDYQNQIINAAQSSGFDKTNAGKTFNLGAEIEIANEWMLNQDTALFGSIVATYVKATQEQGDNKGKDLPYAPRYYGSLTTGLRHNAFETSLELVYVGSMYADEANTTEESLNGLLGKIDPYMIGNVSAQYSLETYSLFASVKNVLDTTYIASRRPEGIFRGIPRQIQVGIQMKF